jgi:hypothetical protein
MTALEIPSALVLLDYFGIAVFAISGALVAAEKRWDFVTFIFFADRRAGLLGPSQRHFADLHRCRVPGLVRQPP